MQCRVTKHQLTFFQVNLMILQAAYASGKTKGGMHVAILLDVLLEIAVSALVMLSHLSCLSLTFSLRCQPHLDLIEARIIFRIQCFPPTSACRVI